MSEEAYSVYGNLENRTTLYLIKHDDSYPLFVNGIDIIDLINLFRNSGIDVDREHSTKHIRIPTKDGLSEPLQFNIFPDPYAMGKDDTPSGVITKYTLRARPFYNITLEDFVDESNRSKETISGICCNLFFKTTYGGTGFLGAREVFDKVSSVTEILGNKFILTSDSRPIG